MLFNKLVEVAKMNMKSNLSYVFAAWGAFMSNIVQIFVFYYIWMAVYGGHALLNGVNKEQMVMYIILSRILYTQVTWNFIYVIAEKIKTGEIAMDLLRPIDFQLYMYTGRFGDILAFGVMNALPSLLISGLFLGFYFPHNPISYLYFFLSLVMAITISFFVEFWIGLLTFYTTNSWGLSTFQEALVSFFSGALVPLAFFPIWLRHIVDILPFKDMIYTPIAIYLGLIKGSEVPYSLITQFVWVILMFVLSRLFFKSAIKKVTVQGG